MAEPEELRAEPWQRTCPHCGYENGFHISFRRIPSDEPGDGVAVWLICPSCSTCFDIGMRTRLVEVARA